MPAKERKRETTGVLRKDLYLSRTCIVPFAVARIARRPAQVMTPRFW